jgi:hypothetical protein
VSHWGWGNDSSFPRRVLGSFHATKPPKISFCIPRVLIDFLRYAHHLRITVVFADPDLSEKFDQYDQQALQYPRNFGVERGPAGGC